MSNIQPYLFEIWIGTIVAITILQLVPLSVLALRMGFAESYFLTSMFMLVPVVISFAILKCLALVDGLEHWFGITGALSIAVAFLVAWMPFVGMVVGIAAAYDAWDLGILTAFAFFYSPGILGSMLAGLLTLGILLLVKIGGHLYDRHRY